MIDPRKAGKARAKADEERTLLFKRAVQGVLGSRFSKSRYRYLLTLVNQIGLKMKNPVGDKENLAAASTIDGGINDENEANDEPLENSRMSSRGKNKKHAFREVSESKVTATRACRLLK